MIHDIGIVLALAKSPVRRIDSVGINVLSKTEDIANARIEFESGCVANLSASRISMKPNREIRIFQEDAYLSLDFMNQKGHLIKKSDIIAYGIKLKIGLAKAGDSSAIPVHTIPIEKGEPLAIELAHFIDSVGRARQPKVGAELGKSALEVAIRITEQIRAGATLMAGAPPSRSGARRKVPELALRRHVEPASDSSRRKTMPDDDRVEGAAKQIKGNLKEGVGKVTGDTKLEGEGKADKAEGKIQNTVGGIKDALLGKK